MYHNMLLAYNVLGQYLCLIHSFIPEPSIISNMHSGWEKMIFWLKHEHLIDHTSNNKSIKLYIIYTNMYVLESSFKGKELEQDHRNQG